jgi:hypothetical protein
MHELAPSQEESTESTRHRAEAGKAKANPMDRMMEPEVFRKKVS